MSPSTTLLVIGASVAAGALITQLRTDGFTGRVVVVDHDPDAPYDRPPLSKEFLVTTADRPEAPWWDERCELVQARASALHISAGAVELVMPDGSRRSIGARHIVIATGAAPVRLPGQPDGVAHLRTASDARRIRAVAAPGRHVIILGAGTVGTELASSLVDAGCAVTLVDQADRPLDRFLGGHLAVEAAAWIRDAGVTLQLGARVEQIDGDGDGWLVTTDSGKLPADVVVSAVGTRPAIQWLVGSGLDLTDGIRCDGDGTALDTSGDPIPNVHAIGDVSAWTYPGVGPRRHEDWTSAGRQGRHLARHLLGLDPLQPAAERTYFWSSQFGRRIQVLGTPRRDATLVRHLDEPSRAAAFYTLERDSHTVAWISINAPKQFALAMRESLNSQPG